MTGGLPMDGLPDACLRARLAATALIDGEAADPEVAEVRRHLIGCAACRGVVERHERLARLTREGGLAWPQRALLPTRRPSVRRTGAALLVAACLAAAGATGALVASLQDRGAPRPPAGPTLAERTTATDESRPG
jgi:predicted anti-sigma-YlaC factor YlaD